MINLQKFIRGFIILFGSTAISVFLILPLLAPKIEGYTQNAPISFFSGISQKDAYLLPIGYKSYAPYFYGKLRLENSKLYKMMDSDEFEEYLLIGKIDKDAYFSAKYEKGLSMLKDYPDLKLLYIKNGFVFMMRKSNGI